MFLKKIASFPWHWWLILVVLLTASILVVLNFAIGWHQPWLTLAGSIVALLSGVYTFRQLWVKSGQGSSEDVQPPR